MCSADSITVYHSANILSGLQVRFRNPIKYKQDKEMFIAPEGLYSGQVL